MSPTRTRCQGGCLSSRPAACTCVHVCSCVERTLPAAFATSAGVTFWTLALTLKVTAGPRTLGETIEKGQCNSAPSMSSLSAGPHDTLRDRSQRRRSPHGPRGLRVLCVDPGPPLSPPTPSFPFPSDSTDRACLSHIPSFYKKLSPTAQPQALAREKLLWKQISVSGSQGSRECQRQEGEESL